VLSSRSAASEYVKDEINWAVEHRRGHLIPILQSDCNLIDFHIRLPRIHYIDWRHDPKIRTRSRSPASGGVPLIDDLAAEASAELLGVLAVRETEDYEVRGVTTE
jgi:hypothetical protein